MRGLGHRAAHRRSRDQHPKTRLNDPHLVHGHQRPARRLPQLRLQCLPRGLRQRSRAGAFRAVRALRPRRRDGDPGSDHRARRAGAPDPPRLHPRDPDLAVHDLPHAPAEHVPEQLLRHIDVGLRVRRAVHVAEEAEVSDRRGGAAHPRPQSGRGRDPGQVGRSEFLRDVSKLDPQLKDTQFADYHGHGWNFRAVFKRDRAGTLLDGDGHIVRRRRPGQVQEGRCTWHLDPPRPRLAMRRLPLRAGRPRQRPHLRRGRRGGGDRLHRLPRHRRRYPTLRTSGPAAPPGGTDLSLLRTQDGRRRFEWRGGKLLSSARPWTRSSSGR